MLIAVAVVRIGARGAMVREDVLAIAHSESAGWPLGAEGYSAGGVSDRTGNGLEVLSSIPFGGGMVFALLFFLPFLVGLFFGFGTAPRSSKLDIDESELSLFPWNRNSLETAFLSWMNILMLGMNSESDSNSKCRMSKEHTHLWDIYI